MVRADSYGPRVAPLRRMDSAILPRRACGCKPAGSLDGSYQMSDHKFKIGQVVNYRPRSKVVEAGVYQIAQLMPPAGDEPQYRIKSETEAHLRSARESELSPLNRR